MPDSIDLGAAVRVWFAGRIEEGVVIAVVSPGAAVTLARVVCAPAAPYLRRSLSHYVVQCWDRRVLRHAGEIIVDSP